MTAFGVGLSLVVVLWIAAFLPSDTAAVGPIVINGNDGLENSQYVTGEGTPGNPYVIEGLEIIGPDHGIALTITGTNAYLVIRDISILCSGKDALSFGIYLDTVENCAIESVDVIECYYAIWAQTSNHISVKYSDISQCGTGIYLHYTDNAEIMYNSIIGESATGMYGYDSAGVLVHGNNISQCLDSAVIMDHCLLSYSQISGNIFFENVGDTADGGGVSLLLSSMIWVFNNSFIGNTLYQAFDDDAFGVDNFWNNTYYDGGGNYWSDGVTTDYCSGEYPQTIPGSDEIVDVPYDIPVNSTDYYPLVEPIPEFDTLLVPVSAMLVLFVLMLSRRSKTARTR